MKPDTHSRQSLIPASEWLAGYQRRNLLNDTVAAVIVTMLLIPQSLAYALLAGLPAEMGLYACIYPCSHTQPLAAVEPCRSVPLPWPR